jgi:peptidyl-tRNA hydrolase, PTH1 family
MSTDLWLVVGLGNPGPEYAGNRHNVGFMVVDALAGRIGGRFKSHRARADVIEGRLPGTGGGAGAGPGAGAGGGTRVVLAKPRSFMNLSGGPVAGLRDFYKVPVERIVVVHDELDIPYGTVRLKLGGGDNGHNGLRSVTKSLGDRNYLRTRFGIGRPPGRMDPAAFVLRDFSVTERKELDLHIERAADATEALISAGLAQAQNAFHGM